MQFIAKIFGGLILPHPYRDGGLKQVFTVDSRTFNDISNQHMFFPNFKFSNICMKPLTTACNHQFFLFGRNQKKCPHLHRNVMFTSTSTHGVWKVNLTYLCKAEHFIQFLGKKNFLILTPTLPLPKDGRRLAQGLYTTLVEGGFQGDCKQAF